MRKVLRMTDGLISRLNNPALALSMIMGAVLLAGFGGIFGNCPASAGDLADPPPAQSEIRVTFSPNPAKTGFLKDSAGNFESSLLKHVIATVSPPSARVDITFSQMWEEEGTGRIEDFRETLEESGNDKWEFDVGGTYESNRIYPWGDIIILAWYKNSQAVGTERVIVVVPDKIGKPHDQKQGQVTPINFGMNMDSSPADSTTPANQARLVTGYYQPLTVAVVDQFGEPLEAAYAGQSVFENVGGWQNINQTLTANGTYTDRTGPQIDLAAGGLSPVLVAKNGPDELAWMMGLEFFVNGVTIPANLILGLDTHNFPPDNVSVRIAGHVLSEGVVNRQIQATAPNTIKIVWPD